VDTEEEADDTLVCTDCGQTAENSGCDIIELGDNKYCTSCLNCCDACGEYYMYVSSTHWYADICSDCQDDHFSCPNCSSVHHFDDSISSTDSEET